MSQAGNGQAQLGEDRMGAGQGNAFHPPTDEVEFKR